MVVCYCSSFCDCSFSFFPYLGLRPSGALEVVLRCAKRGVGCVGLGGVASQRPKIRTGLQIGRWRQTTDPSGTQAPFFGDAASKERKGLMRLQLDDWMQRVAGENLSPKHDSAAPS